MNLVIVNDVFEEVVEYHLHGPVFVIDYPAAMCPLTKRKKGEPEICPACKGLGYIGRTAIFELLIVDDKIKQALLKAPNAETITVGRLGTQPRVQALIDDQIGRAHV